MPERQSRNGESLTLDLSFEGENIFSHGLNQRLTKTSTCLSGQVAIAAYVKANVVDNGVSSSSSLSESLIILPC